MSFQSFYWIIISKHFNGILGNIYELSLRGQSKGVDPLVKEAGIATTLMIESEGIQGQEGRRLEQQNWKSRRCRGAELGLGPLNELGIGQPALPS